MLRQIVSVLCSISLVECTGLYGPQPVIGVNGQIAARPHHTTPFQSPAASVNSTDMWERLQGRAVAAATNDAAVPAFLQEGWGVLFSNCNEYFRRMGSDQRDSQLGRDLVAPFIALLTGAIALKTFTATDQRQRLLQAMSLGSSFVTSDIDLYDKHFLFNADNIDSVRELTLNAMAAHADAVMKLQNVGYSDAIRHLIDLQTYCLPPRILSLTREAIAKGKVKARVVGDSPEALVSDVAEDLGGFLNPPSSLSDQQIIALWWLFRGSPDPKPASSDYKKIHDALAGLPPEANPIEEKAGTPPTYAYKEHWAYADRVKSSLDKLPPEVIDKLKGDSQSQAGINPLFQNPLSRLPVRSARGASERVTVGIDN